MRCSADASLPISGWLAALSTETITQIPASTGALEQPVLNVRSRVDSHRPRRTERRLLARRMSAPPPPSVTTSREVVGSECGRHGKHPGASVNVAGMPIGRHASRRRSPVVTSSAHSGRRVFSRGAKRTSRASSRNVQVGARDKPHRLRLKIFNGGGSEGYADPRPGSGRSPGRLQHRSHMPRPRRVPVVTAPLAGAGFPRVGSGVAGLDRGG